MNDMKEKGKLIESPQQTDGLKSSCGESRAETEVAPPPNAHSVPRSATLYTAGQSSPHMNLNPVASYWAEYHNRPVGEANLEMCHFAEHWRLREAEAPREPLADERTKIENWAKGKNLPTMPNGDVYVHVDSQMAWEARQARAELREAESPRQPSADERATFEHWCREELLCDPENLERLTGGKGAYRLHNVQCFWMGWNARAELREVSQHPVPAPLPKNLHGWRTVCTSCGCASNDKSCNFNCVCHGEHPVPAPETQTQGDNAELVRMAEKLLEWMPIYSKGSSGNIRQTNLRAAIEKFKVEHPEPAKGKP